MGNNLSTLNRFGELRQAVLKTLDTRKVIERNKADMKDLTRFFRVDAVEEAPVSKEEDPSITARRYRKIGNPSIRQHGITFKEAFSQPFVDTEKKLSTFTTVVGELYNRAPHAGVVLYGTRKNFWTIRPTGGLKRLFFGLYGGSSPVFLTVQHREGTGPAYTKLTGTRENYINFLWEHIWNYEFNSKFTESFEELRDKYFEQLGLISSGNKMTK